MSALHVLRAGPLTLVEDLGRSGLAHIGVTRSGAADRRSHRLANRLVGNSDGRATLEITMGGFAARAVGGDVDVAVTGAGTDPAVDGVPFGLNSLRRIRAGQVLTVPVPRTGLRNYLAVRGGIAVEPVLGSRSHDVLSAIGPPPLRPGDVLAVGPGDGGYPDVEQAPVAAVTHDILEVAVVPGPRDDWFTDPDALVHTTWVVSDHSDRVGIRLLGPALAHRRPDRQLPSEGAVRGTIQVPPNGRPVILGPDHPVTGGYPVIGVLTDAAADAVAQLRPGRAVRMRWNRPRITARSATDW